MTHGSHYHFSETYLKFSSISNHVKLDKKFCALESLLGIILSSSRKCDTSILHIKDMYTNNT